MSIIPADNDKLEHAFTDPSQTGPNFLFNNGQVSGVTALYDATIPTAPGGTDTSWAVIQWGNAQFFDPANPSAPISDPTLGTSVANYETADGLNGFAAFGTPGNYVYRLTDIGGTLKDVFLQNVNPTPNFTFDHQVTFTADEGMPQTIGDTSKGPTTIGNCFTVAFNRPGTTGYNPNEPVISTFLQMPIIDQRGMPENWPSSGWVDSVPESDNANQFLSWQPDQSLHKVTIDLSSAMANAAQWMLQHLSWNTQWSLAGSDLLDMSRWTLGSVFIGSETLPGGGATFDVSNIDVTSDPDTPFTAADAKATVQTVDGGITYADYQNGLTSSTGDTADTSSTWIQHVGYSNLGTIYSVSADGAKINTTAIQAPTDIFAADHSFSATGADMTIVMTGTTPQISTVTSTSGGGNTLWTADSTTDFSANGSNMIVMGGTAHDSGTLKISDATDAGPSTTTTVCVWGSSDATTEIDKTGSSSATIFGGASTLHFTGNNSTLVFGGPANPSTPDDNVWWNGNPPTGGAAAIGSTGGNTVWAGGVNVEFHAASTGSDTLVIGSGALTAYGNATAGSSLDIEDQGQGGKLTYTAGAENASVNLTASQDSITGGSGTLGVTAQGSSNLTFVGSNGTTTLSLSGAAANVTSGSGQTNIAWNCGNLTCDIGSAITSAMTIDGFHAGAGSITGFTAARNTIDFKGGSIVSAHLTSGSGLSVLMTDGQTVSISGVTSADHITQGGSALTLT